ncbi:hypothetical protein FACS1894164_18490 [Spirochaetia bacterium]|nr:hypothetical protein FACS1894164_18490 [Spirochaetia bacterium]
MLDLKVSGIIAGVAFVLSFLVGILSGVSIVWIIIRAFIFAAVFFGLTIGVHWVIQHFIPDLMPTELSDEHQHVDISVGEPEETAPPASNSSQTPTFSVPEAGPGSAESTTLPIDSVQPATLSRLIGKSPTTKGALGKDYDASTLASAIQTILKKD